MDRFEEGGCPDCAKYIGIYIPVWIDLKSDYQAEKWESYDLHSSMDRFEAGSRQFQCDTQA